MSDNITAIHPSWEIIHGDALKVLREFAPNTFDAVITDPPYASGGPDPGGEEQIHRQEVFQHGRKRTSSL